MQKYQSFDYSFRTFVSLDCDVCQVFYFDHDELVIFAHSYNSWFMKLRFIILFWIPLIALSCSKRLNPEITAEELSEHVYHLASDEFKGRMTGTDGDRLSAEYIEQQFRRMGMIIPDDPAIGSFSLTLGVELDSSSKLQQGGDYYKLGIDFVPLAMSETAKAEGEVVVAGYGFILEQGSPEWDDFRELDVNGKVVMILLGAPEFSGEGEDPYEQAGAIRSKVLNAKDRGAAAVLLVAGPAYDEGDKFSFESRRENTAGIPVVRIGRHLADAWLASAGTNIARIESSLNDERIPVSFKTGLQVSLEVKLRVNQAETRNAMAYLPSRLPDLEHGWLVIGAHFDHLGMGGDGSSSRQPDTLAIHFGADDNASGVAGLLEIAGWFAARKDSLKRPVLFIAFTGEELGLLGSKHFVESGWIKPSDISGMINLDMIGRPNAQKSLSIGGTGTAAELDRILDEIDFKGFKPSRSPEGYGPSDHAAFYQAGIPVLYFSTGAHGDYHTPHDSPDKLDYESMKTLSEAIASIAWEIERLDSDLTFTEAGPRTATSGRRNLKVTFGIMPDFAGSGNEGLRVDFVTPGKPADLGGMLKGDVITGISGKPVGNIYEYMTRLQQLKPGQVISVDVLRDEVKLVLIIQL